MQPGKLMDCCLLRAASVLVSPILTNHKASRSGICTTFHSQFSNYHKDMNVFEISRHFQFLMNKQFRWSAIWTAVNKDPGEGCSLSEKVYR